MQVTSHTLHTIALPYSRSIAVCTPLHDTEQAMDAPEGRHRVMMHIVQLPPGLAIARVISVREGRGWGEGGD